VIGSIVVLGLVTGQRLGELVLARRNTRRLLKQGGREVGASHYPFIVLLHGAWLAGLWILAWDRPVSPWWLGAYLVLQGLRLWVMGSLGPRWTTRIIILPRAPLVRAGPYRFFPHPNYLVVFGEIAVLPLAFGLPLFAALFSSLNGLMIAIRVRAENHALARSGGPVQPPMG
jgi:methyltransferase